MNFADVVQKYIELRDLKSTLKADYEAKLKPVEEAMSRLELVMLAQFDATGVESMKTPMGTCYVSTQTRGSVADKEAFMEFVKSNNEWPLLEVRCAKNNIEAFIEQHNGELPPGINWSVERVVNFRRKT